MTAGRRWGIVVLGVLLLLSTPFVLRALPAADADVSARGLLARIVASRSDSFSGLVETRGSVPLPANDALTSLTSLFAQPNRVRVWWRDRATWRTSTLRTTGETDLVHRGDATTRWVYESKRATITQDVPVRLPTTVDLLPHELARHVLQGARTSELSRLPPRRVAGRDALGLRVVPSTPEASISSVDVWADRSSGVPLSVEVHAKGVIAPVLTSTYADFELGRPSASALRFDPPGDARVRFDRLPDVASAADRFAERQPPARLAGLPARRTTTAAAPDVPGSVGVYGRGPTVLLAIPLWRRYADIVGRDLRGQPGVTQVDAGLSLGAAPLRLLLTPHERGSGTSWLLAGTVTEKGLVAAAAQLARQPPPAVHR